MNYLDDSNMKSFFNNNCADEELFNLYGPFKTNLTGKK